MPKAISRMEAMQIEELLLSKERTILSFMRTGLAFITAGAAIFGIFQSLIVARAIGYILVGVGFVEVFESMRRLVLKQKEIDSLKKNCRA